MRDLDPSQYGEADRREVIRGSRWRQRHGRLAGSSIGGSRNGKCGGGVYAVQTVASGGSERLTFVVSRVSDRSAMWPQSCMYDWLERWGSESVRAATVNAQRGGSVGGIGP
jgi:hypothetical protein